MRSPPRILVLPPCLVPAYVDGEDVLAEFGIAYAALFPAGDPGYTGDPAAATVKAGEQLLEATVADLASFYPRFADAGLKIGSP